MVIGIATAVGAISIYLGIKALPPSKITFIRVELDTSCVILETLEPMVTFPLKVTVPYSVLVPFDR